MNENKKWKSEKATKSFPKKTFFLTFFTLDNLQMERTKGDNWVLIVCWLREKSECHPGTRKISAEVAVMDKSWNLLQKVQSHSLTVEQIESHCEKSPWVRIRFKDPDWTQFSSSVFMFYCCGWLCGFSSIHNKFSRFFVINFYLLPSVGIKFNFQYKSQRIARKVIGTRVEAKKGFLDKENNEFLLVFNVLRTLMTKWWHNFHT